MPSAIFGIVGSAKGGIWCSGKNGLAFVARAEDVVLWDLKKAEIVREFKVRYRFKLTRNSMKMGEFAFLNFQYGITDQLG